MKDDLQLHYLEVVTPDVEQACGLYAKSLNLSFSDPIEELGGARTADLSGGGLLGVRAPMHDEEEPATRPYYLVADIDKAVEDAKNAGAEIALSPMEIPGRGRCAIIFIGSIQSGFWQV